MATELLLVREGTKLAAAEPMSMELIEGFYHREMLTATVRRARNPKFHRLFFALLQAVFAAQSRYATMESLLDAVKVATGHYEIVTLPGPVPVPILKPKSVSFARMDETAFRQFFEKAVLFIIAEVLPGVNRPDLEQEVLAIAGPE